MSLIKGFVEMIKQENLICAIPLLRLQLDNSLRFYAAFLVENPHELASHFIEGEAIRRLTEKKYPSKINRQIISRKTIRTLSVDWWTYMRKHLDTYI